MNEAEIFSFLVMNPDFESRSNASKFPIIIPTNMGMG